MSKGALRYLSLLIFFLVLIAGFQTQISAQQAPRGKLFYITDHAVYGCAYNPDDYSDRVDIHVYGEGLGQAGSLGVAGYSCPWITPATPNYNRYKGFYILYRRPLDTTNYVSVYMLDNNGDGAWINPSGAIRLNWFNRVHDTFFYENDNYAVGISRKNGASVTEFYNKRIDGSVNLIQPDIGAAFQAALFGAGDQLVAQPTSFPSNYWTERTCVTPEPSPSNPMPAIVGDLRYNPTQAGSICANPATGDLTPSTIDFCESSIPGACNAKIIRNTPGYIQWRVRFRNFYYPKLSSFPYQSYDDVYAHVSYTFHTHYMQVDYRLWKTASQKWGSSFQQLPIAFLSQITRFKYKKAYRNKFSKQRISNRDVYEVVESNFPIRSDSGRWITAISENNRSGAVPVLSPGNHLTFAFYSQPINNFFGSECAQSRFFQLEFLAADGASQHASAIQNYLNFEVESQKYYQARALVFPYRGISYLPDQAIRLRKRIDLSSTHPAGFRPEWECNL